MLSHNKTVLSPFCCDRSLHVRRISGITRTGVDSGFLMQAMRKLKMECALSF